MRRPLSNRRSKARFVTNRQCQDCKFGRIHRDKPLFFRRFTQIESDTPDCLGFRHTCPKIASSRWVPRFKTALRLKEFAQFVFLGTSIRRGAAIGRNPQLLASNTDNISRRQFFPAPSFHDSVEQNFSRLDQYFCLATRSNNSTLLQKLIQRHGQGTTFGQDRSSGK